ncbi:MAG: hypothetical protein HYY17_04650 [Planctomycetes bacterium]|nr:hypothetical protein [Planctomycetota bacterium]
MKRLWLLPVALLAACGGQPSGAVRFMGGPRIRSADPDNRAAESYCLTCGTKAYIGISKCPNGKCQQKLTWSETYPCGFCGATGDCRACRVLDQAGSACFNCKGTGVITYEGRTPQCPQCKGTGKCGICAGSGKCDLCKGNKKLTKTEVEELVKKLDKKGGEEAKP